jgi:hypothetical protein
MAESYFPSGLDRSTRLAGWPIGSIALIAVLLGLGCSSGGSSSTPLEGHFVDTVVDGIIVTIGDDDQVTDEDGSFDYAPGDTIELYLGEIPLGGTLLPANGIVTPVEAASVATNLSDYGWRVCRLANLCVTEMSTLSDAELQSLVIILTLTWIDSDDDLSNGIQITQVQRDAATMALGFEFDDPTLLANLVTGNGWNSTGVDMIRTGIVNPLRAAAALPDLVNLNASSSLSHFLTQGGMLAAQVSGSYTGPWTSPDANTYSIKATISPNGDATVQLLLNGSLWRTLSGSVVFSDDPLVGDLTAVSFGGPVITDTITMVAKVTPAGIVGTWDRDDNGALTNGDTWANKSGSALGANAILTVRFEDAQVVRQEVVVSGAGNDQNVYPWLSDAGDLIAELPVTVSQLLDVGFDLYLDDLFDESLFCTVTAAALTDRVPIELEVLISGDAIVCGSNFQ